VRRRSARVNDAFGNALVVKMRDFLAQDKTSKSVVPRSRDFKVFWLSLMRKFWLVVKNSPVPFSASGG
jgi:hypothetical protein